jgi:SSS family solute:Na+ symporter
MVTMVVVSYMTAEPDEARLEGLTFATLTDEQRAETRASWNWRDVVTSVLVVVIIGCIYLYFR